MKKEANYDYNRYWHGYTANKKTITVMSNKNQDVVFEYTKNQPKPTTKNKPKPDTPVQEDINSPKTYDNRGIYIVEYCLYC